MLHASSTLQVGLGWKLINPGPYKYLFVSFSMLFMYFMCRHRADCGCQLVSSVCLGGVGPMAMMLGHEW